MKNRLLTVAMAALCAIGMISCGNPAEPEEFVLSKENVDDYIVSMASYEGLTSSAVKESVTDSDVETYADYYYASLAKEVEGMTDEKGEPIPMTDEAIEMLGSKAYKNVTEFMVFVRNTVIDYYEYSYESDIVQDVISQVAAASEFKDIPAGLLAKERDFISEQFTEIAKNYNLEVRDYLVYCGTSEEELSLEYAKQELVFYKIAKDRNIDDTDKDAMDSEVFKYLLSVTNVTE